MKTKQFLLGFMCFSLFAFAIIIETRGQYTCGVTAGTSVRLCGIINGKSIDYTYESKSNPVDAGANWNITWTWTGVGCGPPQDMVQRLPKNPATASPPFDLALSYSVAAAIPVDNYISALATAFGVNYSSPAPCVLMSGDTTNGIESTYDNNTGLISTYKVYAGGSLIIDVSTECPMIIGYDLPVLLGVAAVSIIGLIYIIRKKR